MLLSAISKPFWPNDIETWISVVQAVVTILAIILGGLWTLKVFGWTREKHPKANVIHDLSHWDLPDGHVLVRVHVLVENTGKVLLKLSNGFVRIQKILPCEPHILDWLKENMEAEITETEAKWPMVGQRSMWDGENEIEPGESEILPFDFILKNSVDAITVYSHMANSSKKNSVGWSQNTVYDLRATANQFHKEIVMNGKPDPRPQPHPKPPPIPPDPYRDTPPPTPRPQGPPKSPPPPPPPPQR